MGSSGNKLTKIRIKIYILCAGPKLGQFAAQVVVILGVLGPGCFFVFGRRTFLHARRLISLVNDVNLFLFFHHSD